MWGKGGGEQGGGRVCWFVCFYLLLHYLSFLLCNVRIDIFLYLYVNVLLTSYATLSPIFYIISNVLIGLRELVRVREGKELRIIGKAGSGSMRV